MATAKDEEDAKAQSQNLEIREGLNDAYAALEAQKTTQTFSAYTIEDALDAQIESIEGGDTKMRPNALHRVGRIEAQLNAVVTKIKALPPGAFQPPDKERDVNTPP